MAKSAWTGILVPGDYHLSGVLALERACATDRDTETCSEWEHEETDVDLVDLVLVSLHLEVGLYKE